MRIRYYTELPRGCLCYGHEHNMACCLPKQDLLQGATQDRANLTLEKTTYFVGESMDQHNTTE